MITKSDVFMKNEESKILISERQLSEIVGRAVKEAMSNDEFTISRKQHYDQHRELEEFLKMLNNVRNSFGKWLLSLAFLGMTIIIGIGAAKSLKG